MTLRGGMMDNCSFPTFYYFCMGGRSAEVQSTQARHKPAGVFPGSSVPWESYWGSLSLSFLICKMRNNKLVSTSAVKNLSARAGDIGLIPGLGRSPGGGNTNLLEYSCLGSPWTEEPGGLQSMRSQRVGHNCDWTWLNMYAHRPRRLLVYFFQEFHCWLSLACFSSLFQVRLHLIYTVEHSSAIISRMACNCFLRDIPRCYNF